MEHYESLVRQVQAAGGTRRSQQEAFAGLMEQFHAPALAWAYTTLGDFALAEDAAQEAFVTAYRHMHQLREPRAFPAWLRSIVRTQCNRLTRGGQPVASPLEESELAAEHDDPEQQAEQAETRAQVRHALHTLPAADRQIIELYYMTGYAQNEIAVMLDLPLTAVRKRLQYARQRLRVALPELTGPTSLLNSVAALPDWAALMEVDTLLYGYAASFVVAEPLAPAAGSVCR